MVRLLVVTLALGLAEDVANVPHGSTQRELTKVRADSMLHREFAHNTADLRGSMERLRDAELNKHTGRLAALDVIRDLGKKDKDNALLERVEDAARNEMQRFRNVMRQFSVSALAQARSGKASTLSVPSDDVFMPYRDQVEMYSAKINSGNAWNFAEDLAKQISSESE